MDRWTHSRVYMIHIEVKNIIIFFVCLERNLDEHQNSVYYINGRYIGVKNIFVYLFEVGWSELTISMHNTYR